MNQGVVAGVVVASLILGLAAGCGTMTKATGRIMVKGGEPAIATVLAFAEAPEFRAEVARQGPTTGKTEFGLHRHRNTAVLDVTARAADPTTAKAAAESMLKQLRKKFPGPGEPKVEILEHVKMAGP